MSQDAASESSATAAVGPALATDHVDGASTRVLPGPGAIVLAADKHVCDRLCETINEKLTEAKLAASPLVFSEPVRQLFRRAWTMAVDLRSRDVTIDHLVVALASEGSAASEAFGATVASDVGSLLAGALVRIASLEETATTQQVDALAPVEGLLRWISAAGQFAAATRPDNRHLASEDFVAVLRTSAGYQTVSRQVRRILIQASRVGQARRELVKSRRGIESIGETVSRFRSDATKELKNVNDKLGALARASVEIKEGVASTSAAESRTSLSLAAVADKLASLDDRIPLQPSTQAADQAGLAALSSTIDSFRNQISAIDQRTSEIQSALPRTPRAGRLTFAILGVIVIGAAAGIALSQSAHSDTMLSAAIRSLSSR